MKRKLSADSESSSIMIIDEEEVSCKKQKISENTETIEIVDSDDERETSPIDSGFKEPSTSAHSNEIDNDDKISTISISDTNSGEKRASRRIKEIVEKENSMTNAEKNLRNYLKFSNLIHPLESISDAIDRYNPKVECKKLTKYHITKRIRLGEIVPKVAAFPTEIEFHGVILHTWRNYDGLHPHYFVRWKPLNILEDEWMIADYAELTNLRKKIKLSDLNTRQRRKICEIILNGLKL